MDPRPVPSWDVYLMQLCEQVAQRSKDPNTQVGAVLADENHRVISTGYNGYLPGAFDGVGMWARPDKYDRVVHAEVNAIAVAARRGIATNKSTLYCTHLPCLNCMKTVLAAGVTRIVAKQLAGGKWDDEHLKALERAREVHVPVFLEEAGEYVT